jgi:ABC-type transport system substrate-binding protein
LSEWIIKIRPGVTFHSGKDLTADDVVYTIQRIISKGNGAHFFGPTDLKNVKALDKLTVRVPMASPFGSFVDQLAGGWYYLYVVPWSRVLSRRPGNSARPRRRRCGTPAGCARSRREAGRSSRFTMRIDQAPFSDVNVRQALRLLVDRQQLINSALDGQVPAEKGRNGRHDRDAHDLCRRHGYGGDGDRDA